MTQGARTLTDADIEAIVDRLVERLRARPAANEKPKTLVISPTIQAAARAELERRGLRAPRRR